MSPMNATGPTMLHKPVAQEAHQLSSAAPLGWLLVTVPIVGVGVWFGLRRQRHARTHPQEHAFRALGRRMKLRQRDMQAVRVYARSAGIDSPIAVLMDPNRLQEAIK
ncbi:MAG: hypothetical protein CMJ25_00130 [Phycisphaerae bacterium]|nr:hypothetical protein [Phycisphaerae bacterium]